MADNNQTVSTNFYGDQLCRLKKHPSIVNRKGLCHPHTTNLTKEELGWEKLSHSPYSLDLALSYYLWIRVLQNHLDGLRLKSREEIKHKLFSYFASKSEEF